MKLKTGVIIPDAGWLNYLQQEGFSYDVLPNEINPDPGLYYCLIISKNSKTNPDKLIEFIMNGGLVVLDAFTYCKIFKLPVNNKKVKTQLPSPKSIYKHIGPVDIYGNIYFPGKTRGLTALDDKLKTFYKNLGKGCFVVIPYNLEEILHNHKALRKQFYFSRRELPSEIVSAVSRSQIREIITTTLRFLHHEMDIPFVQKWYFPEGRNNIFLFRFDTDFCEEKDALEFYRLCHEYKIKATWFVDTNSEKMLDTVYKKMQDQEIELHCDRHLIFKDHSLNLDNISRGMKKMRASGYQIKGFAAPYGEWNYSLQQVLREKGFVFSSEFGLAYDDLPFFVDPGNKFAEPLQIPIHPVSLGRLRRSHFSETEMYGYYLDLINRNLKREIPLAIYHHPHHKHLQVFQKVFEKVKELKIGSLNMMEYALWWKQRLDFSPELEFERENQVIRSNKTQKKFWLKLNYRDKYTVQQQTSLIKTDVKAWKNHSSQDVPDDIMRIKKIDWRYLLYNYESFRGKSRQ